jgi:hypothetical protein
VDILPGDRGSEQSTGSRSCSTETEEKRGILPNLVITSI